MSLTDHVKSTVKACNFHLRAIKHIRHLLTEQDTSTLAVSLVHTKLDYCNSLLYNTSITNIHALQRIQNNLARIVVQPTTPTPSLTLLRNLHWLPIQHRITYKIASLTHMALQTKQPSYIHELLVPHQPIRPLRSSNQTLLVMPHTRLHLTDQSFHVAAPTIWNSLPLHLRQITDSNYFRRSLKTHLFASAFT